MAGNRLTNQQLQRQLQEQNNELQAQIQQQHNEFQAQMQAQQGKIQNLTTTLNTMAQGFQVTQAAINQLLSNQGTSSNGDMNKVVTNQTQPAPRVKQTGKKRKAEGDQPAMRDKPVCPTCNRRHAGECWNHKPKCFGCGELGHMKKNCPKRGAREDQANLNAMNVGDAARNNLVQGFSFCAMAGKSPAAGDPTASGDPRLEYATAKTSVWWDIEGCPVPDGCDPNAAACNIAAALERAGYRGPVAISAYGDVNKFPLPVVKALSSTGIGLHHVPAGVKDGSDKKMLVDMLVWAIDNQAPANYLLISGDSDFSSALHLLRMRKYNTLLAQSECLSEPLIVNIPSGVMKVQGKCTI